MKVDGPLLSIIVPIYMVEKYLIQCIESLLVQTYSNKEILLINDGSTDRCGEICDHYALENACIKVFHKDNEGNSATLNLGIEHSKGEYIAFVDGDDYLANKETFRILMKEATVTQADIVVGNYDRDIFGQLIPANEHGFNKNTDPLSMDFRYHGFYSVGHLAYTWGKLYKLSFLQRHNLGLKCYQEAYALDKLFNIECYLNNPKYAFVNEHVYVYRYNCDSVSNSYINNCLENWLKISEEIHSRILACESKEENMDLVAHNLLFSVFFSCKQEYQQSGNSCKAIVAELREYRANKLMLKFSKEVALGNYLGFHKGLLWKVMLRGLSIGLYFKLYWILAFGIKLLVDRNIDIRLSSIGKAIKMLDYNNRKQILMYRK